MVWKAILVISLLVAEFLGISAFISYHNGRSKTSLATMIVCIVAIVLEALALIGG